MARRKVHDRDSGFFELDASPGLLRWRRAWDATSGRRRAALAVTVALLAASVVLFDAASEATPQRIVRIVHAATPAAVTVDAVGCPTSARCGVQPVASPALLAALTSQFAPVKVLAQNRTVDEDSGRIYRNTVVAVSGSGNTVSVQAQCVPGAPATRDYELRTSRSHSDLAGDSVVDAEILTTVVAGRSGGCSLAVQLESAASDAEQRAALALAHDQTAQLTQ
jgi:hypothetical protein